MRAALGRSPAGMGAHGIDREAFNAQHCKRLVAVYKYPRAIEFTSDLPRTISGKTRRVALRGGARRTGSPAGPPTPG